MSVTFNSLSKFVPAKSAQPSIIFEFKAGAYPSEARFVWFTWLGSVLPRRHQTRLERPATDKRSSLLQTLIYYGRKMFYNIGSSFYLKWRTYKFQISLFKKKLLRRKFQKNFLQYFLKVPFLKGRSHISLKTVVVAMLKENFMPFVIIISVYGNNCFCFLGWYFGNFLVPKQFGPLFQKLG